MILPLFLALAGCPAVPADTVPLLPKALVWMAQDTAVVAAEGGVSYEYVNVGDSAVAIFKNCEYLVTLKNSLGADDTLPDPDQPPVWSGGGIAVIFVSRRTLTELDKVVEVVGVVRE